MSDGNEKYITQGLPVWDLHFGKGKVVRVSGLNGKVEWLEVCFADKPLIRRIYTVNGVCQGTIGSVRTLYFSEPIISADLLPRYSPKYKVGAWYVFYRDSTSDDLVRSVIEENEHRLVLADSSGNRMFLRHDDIVKSYLVGDLNFSKG